MTLHLNAASFSNEPWWLWAMLIVLALVLVCELVYIRWYFRVDVVRSGRRAMRRGQLAGERKARALEDLYWQSLGPIEYLNAMLMTLQRTLRERPDLVAELLAEKPTLKAVAS